MKIFAGPIIREIAERRGLSVADIRGPSRRKALVAARLEIIARLRAIEIGPTQIGRLINKDHSTIVHHTHPAHRQRKLARARVTMAQKRAAEREGASA